MTVKILSISLNDGRFILFLSLSGYSVVPGIEPKTILNNKRPIEKFLSGFSWFIIDVIGIYCPERLYPAIFSISSLLVLEEQILLLLYSVLLSTSIKYFYNLDAKRWPRANHSKMFDHIFRTCFGYSIYVMFCTIWHQLCNLKHVKNKVF